MGFKVLVRVHPFILPYAYDNAEKIVSSIADSGAHGFMSEGLKLRVVMPQREKEIYSKIGNVFGIDIISDFKKNGIIEGGDREYNDSDKSKMLDKFDNLANQYQLKFYNADNYVGKRYGCSCECCGTDILRNHKIWAGCSRAKWFEINNNSEEFGKCKVNFTRSQKYICKTIEEVCKEEINKNNIQSNLF